MWSANSVRESREGARMTNSKRAGVESGAF
jgi:hypothetical protein